MRKIVSYTLKPKNFCYVSAHFCCHDSAVYEMHVFDMDMNDVSDKRKRPLLCGRLLFNRIADFKKLFYCSFSSLFGQRQKIVIDAFDISFPSAVIILVPCK